LRNFFETYSDPDGRHPIRLNRPADECHGRLMGHPPAFFPIAFHAACNNIFPFSSAAPGLGKDMVIGKFFGRKPDAAILAFISVSRVNILSGKFHRAFISFYYIQKPDYGRYLNFKTDRVYFLVVFFDYFNLPQAQHVYGLFPVDNF
jgi:hypothetical protein